MLGAQASTLIGERMVSGVAHIGCDDVLVK
jgi:hypothetical protein